MCVGVTLPLKSLPVRGAWIEMVETLLIGIVRSWSLPVRGAWIEIKDRRKYIKRSASLPVRGAWIEITHDGQCEA